MIAVHIDIGKLGRVWAQAMLTSLENVTVVVMNY